MKNLLGIIIKAGRKYCWIKVSNTSYGIIKKFRIVPNLKIKRKEMLGQFGTLTKQGYVSIVC